jgi:hypothetical protein
MCSKKINIDQDELRASNNQKSLRKKKKKDIKSKKSEEPKRDEIEETDAESRLPVMKW